MTDCEDREPFGNEMIGGMFGLADEQTRSGQKTITILTGPSLMLATARSGLCLLERYLTPKVVWLPAFLCPAVLAVFKSPVRFFPVDEKLEISDDNWIREIQAGDMVVFIDYFGFRTWEEHGVKAGQQGAWVVEDAAQAFLSTSFAPSAHYVVTSARKFVGVPDGCVLRAQGGASLPVGALANSPQDWWREALAAATGRRDFDRHGTKGNWFERFQAAEASAPFGPTRMSKLSKSILNSGMDWGSIAARRTENFKTLVKSLAEWAIFPTLAGNAIPLGFPIALPKRDLVRDYLLQQKIYPAIHWKIADSVPEKFDAAHRLSDKIMTIPCDQRYGTTDMEGIIRNLKAAMRI